MNEDKFLDNAQDNRPLVDVHGSCVSYTVIRDKSDENDIKESPILKNHLFFSHTNHWGQMTQPFPVVLVDDDFTDSITPHMRRIMKYNMDKSVPEKLRKSEAKWLMIDFYDSARIQMFYPGGWFTYYMYLKDAAPEFAKLAIPQITESRKLNIHEDDILKDCIQQYMDTVIEKYGADHIILSRVWLNRFVIGEDKRIYEFDESTEPLGWYYDNQRVRDIEEYVLNKYPICCLDISKYFIADWEHGKDFHPVHYEREYYEYANRSIKKIVDGQARCIDTLDELAFSYKLDRNVTTPEGIDNWKQYISSTEANYHANPLMDTLIAGFSLQELAEYRHELAKVYRWLYSEKEYFEDETVSTTSKQETLIGYFENLIRE